MVSGSPVTAADIYRGETYNASLETPGWTTAAYGDGAPAVWSTATVMQGPGPNVKVTSHAILPPIRIGQSYTYGTFRADFHHFDRFELDLRGHTHVPGATFSCLRLKLADIVLI